MIVNYMLDDEGRFIALTSYPIDPFLPAMDIEDELLAGNMMEYRLVDGKIIYDPLLPLAPTPAQQIAALKEQLVATDYAIIKIAEGVATAEEYADVIAQRQEWRAQINALERN